MFHFKSALIGIAATLSAAAANAGELKVISAGAVRTVIGGMIEDYTRKSGQKIHLHHRIDRAVAIHHRVG